MSRDDREARARARREHAVLYRSRLQHVERDLSPVEGAEALSLVTRLTDECWSLAGVARPAYGRREAPCRFVPFRAR
jgi:hypothetical protein